ncbi:MAG: hypothetical protein PWP67_2582 [Clostridium butyricum]|uniref:C4-dicarboxylate ABC transporter n=1 Tax=Clostridium butyricum TaxID=1492 RepID=A0A512TSC8_CLOBU|nr:C4-dicarboxylate ABC transporter [Clostridium butyricum]MDK2829760.1 hypothetical protein [Clostridium butyricum]NOW22749.1 C4-dicarboxylate transporter/malic acid transport protein [Clostridium butyricum]GEQ23187.1 C4-dicarboxylate ABC transporter [Clostridium butyricum]
MKKVDIIKDFSPAWFTIIMGTGSFANILYLLGDSWKFTHNLGIILASLNTILFILFLYPWITRWFKHFDLLKKDLHHPVTGNFFVTMPLAAIILGSNFALMGKPFLGKSLVYICFLAWLIGVIGTCILGIYAGYNLICSEKNLPELINFSWLIPPVGNMAVPLVGNSLVKMLLVNNLDLAKDVMLINLIFFGIGFFLFLLIGGTVFSRLIVHSLPAAKFTPTFWIPLGPISITAISLIGFAESSKALNILSSDTLIYFAAAIIWGLGIWFLGIALMISYRNFKKEGIPFSLSWWAFIFPLGAYAMSSLKIANFFNSRLLYSYTIILILFVTVLWIITFIRTFKGVLNGSLLQANTHNTSNILD